MSSFLQHIITRHISTVPSVQPRLYNRFEPIAAENPLTGDLKEMEATGTVASRQAAMVSQPVSASTAFKATVPPTTAGRSSLSENMHAENSQKQAGNLNDEIFLTPTNALPKTQHEEVVKNIHTVEPTLFKELISIPNHIHHNDHHEHDPEIINNDGQSLLNAAAPSIALNVVSENIHRPDGMNTQGHSVIKVTIGRVDVRANTSTQIAKSRSTVQANTKTSLEDYFKRKATSDR